MEVKILLLCFIIVDVTRQASGAGLEIEEFIEQNTYRLKKKYRPYYHITASVGNLHGPNGFTFYQQQYHIFYQFEPNGGENSVVHWGHAVSHDLVHWIYYPTALIPREQYEINGCLAGSAVEFNSYLTLFYTGAEKKDNNETVFTQNLAISGDGIIFQKFLYNPILKLTHGQTANMRHPHVWKNIDNWYMLLGSSSQTRKGQLVLYTSNDMYKWHEIGVLATSFGDMGFLWENPDLFELNGLDVLILSVRGIENQEFRYKNLYQTGYVVGKFSYGDAKFTETEISTLTYHEIDAGHDFYTVKTTLAPDGRRLLVAWLGMYYSDLKTTRESWASMLTIVRELSLTNEGRLVMTPVREMEELRGAIIENAWYHPGEAFYTGTKYFELHVNTTSTYSDVSLTLEWDDIHQYTITYSSDHACMVVDRGGSDGVRRADWLPESHVYWRIFVDLSSIEVFCGYGEVVFSSRVYPRRTMRVLVGGESEVHITQYKMKRSVGYDKAIRKILKERFLHNINNINNSGDNQ